MISDGASRNASSAAFKLSTPQQVAMQFLLSKSRMVCTWGKINRPLGAWGSWGITSSTEPPELTRPAVKLIAWSSPAALDNAKRKLSMPNRVLALTATGDMPSSSLTALTTVALDANLSTLLSTTIAGISRRWSSCNHSFSRLRSCAWSITKIAMSA